MMERRFEVVSEPALGTNIHMHVIVARPKLIGVTRCSGRSRGSLFGWFEPPSCLISHPNLSEILSVMLKTIRNNQNGEETLQRQKCWLID